jgi:hypothetical protein
MKSQKVQQNQKVLVRYILNSNIIHVADPNSLGKVITEQRNKFLQQHVKGLLSQKSRAGGMVSEKRKDLLIQKNTLIQ